MVAEPKLVCPLCGHDGTAATATSSLECYGFNYLEDDVVCREVRGVDEHGRLRLGDQLRPGGGPGGNPRIECRSCWQTFPLPEGVVPMTDQPPPAPGAATIPAGAEPAEAGPSFPDAGLNRLAQRIAGSLLELLSGAVQEARQRSERDLSELQGQVSSLTAAAARLPALADELETLRKQADTFSEAERNLSLKLTGLEIAFSRHEQGFHRIEEELRSVSVAQEEIRRTLEAQAGLLSGLERATGQLESALKGQQESIERYSADAGASIAQLGGRLGSLDANLATQAQAMEGIREVVGRLEDSQKALADRLDKQAGVIRSLHAAAAAQAGHRDELRSALQKLEELAGPDLPPALPEGL